MYVMESSFTFTVTNSSHSARTADFMPVVPLPNIIKNTTQAAADMIGNLGPRQSSSRGSGGANMGGGSLVPPQGTASPMPQRTNSLRGERDGSRRGQASPIPQPPPEERYVVYIRLPFERRGFVDPPQVSVVLKSSRDDELIDCIG